MSPKAPLPAACLPWQPWLSSLIAGTTCAPGRARIRARAPLMVSAPNSSPPNFLNVFARAVPAWQTLREGPFLLDGGPGSPIDVNSTLPAKERAPRPKPAGTDGTEETTEHAVLLHTPKGCALKLPLRNPRGQPDYLVHWGAGLQPEDSHATTLHAEGAPRLDRPDAPAPDDAVNTRVGHRIGSA